MSILEKVWSKPKIEVLSYEKTMASAFWGKHDAAYDANDEEHMSPHHS